MSCFNCPKIEKLKSFEKNLLRFGFYDKNSEGGEVNIPSTCHPLLKLRISCFNCPKIKKLKSFEKLLRLGFYDKNSEGGG